MTMKIRSLSKQKHEIGRTIDNSIDRSLNAHQFFSMEKIDNDNYFLIKNRCKVYLKNYASQLREQKKVKP